MGKKSTKLFLLVDFLLIIQYNIYKGVIKIAAHYVKCPICGQTFNRDVEECVPYGARRYAHKSCSEEGPPPQPKVKKKVVKNPDEEELKEYIKKLFNLNYVPPRAQKQINQYVKEYNFTYSGMRKCLYYFYEIKKNDIEKAHQGIGILPYIWQEAYDYFYQLETANKQNEGKDLSQYVPNETTVIIPVPQRRPKKRNLFSFLDKE